MTEFEKFPKIPRLNRECIITEKIDGTNAQLVIEEGNVWAGSRNRFITPGKTTDNYGFAQWAHDNSAELLEMLGEGTHYGEWYGQGIARNYGLDHRRFALFNTERWKDLPKNEIGLEVVPVLCRTKPSAMDLAFWVQDCEDELSDSGSQAVPGFMRPEGIVVFHTAANQLFKVTLENDEKPKGSTE